MPTWSNLHVSKSCVMSYCSSLITVRSFCLSVCLLHPACVRLIPKKLQKIRSFLPSGGHISGRDGRHPTIQMRVTDFMRPLECAREVLGSRLKLGTQHRDTGRLTEEESQNTHEGTWESCGG